MSRVSDHIRRDAEHAARAEISVVLSKYQRRFYEASKAHLATALANAQPGEEIDGTELGREAARAAIAGYLGPAVPHEAIDAPEPTVSQLADPGL